MPDRPAAPIVVHSLREAEAALAAAVALGCPVTLVSAPAAGAHGGAGWFCALVDAARADHPAAVVTAIFDCADLPGCAQAAIRAGVPDLCFTGSPDLFSRLSAIAAAAGVRLHDANTFAGPRLDLRNVADPVAACRRWLGG
jgi:hypothetical protein